MRKIIAMGLALIMVLTMCGSTLAAETEPNGTTALKLVLTTGCEDVTLAVYLQGGADVTNGGLTVTYDTAAELLSVEKTDAYTVSSVNDTEDGTVTLAWVGSSITEESTLLLTLKFYTGLQIAKDIPFAVKSNGLYAGKTPVEAEGDTATAAAWSNPFEDTYGHWGAEAIEKVTKIGLFLGMSESKFMPEELTTRAQFVMVLYRMAGCPEIENADHPFEDVPVTAYYADAVAWAVANNVVKGMSATSFGPDLTITREQLVTMLCRYAALIDHADATGIAELTSFTDASLVDFWAQDAVRWAIAEDILHGYPDGTLRPLGEATRAEIATLLCNYLGI